jgi:peptidoglycan/LPS O-acetylase OafA/YrhL
MSATNKTTENFAWIDCLRGLASLAVVLFHVRVDCWVGWNEIYQHPEKFSLFDRLAALLSIPMPLFGSAVMLFFLVSGFCIHYPHAAGGRSLQLKSYSIRRFLRIYPAYIAALLLGASVEEIIQIMNQYPVQLSGQFFPSVLMIQNYMGGQITANQSLWSLPVEIELYIFYLVFYKLFTSWGEKPTFILVACISTVAALLQVSRYAFLEGNFAVYWIIWCTGAWLAEQTKKGNLPVWRSWFWWIVMAIFVLAIVASLRKFPLPLQNFAWTSFYFGLLYWGFKKNDPLQNLHALVKRFLQLLGNISYSLYLIHYPFFALCSAIWIHSYGGKPANFFVPLLFSVFSLLPAYVLYRLIEKPSHQLARALAATVSGRA